MQEDERESLDFIRGLWNEYLHLNTIRSSGKQIKEDSLKVVIGLTKLLNERKLSLKERPLGKSTEFHNWNGSTSNDANGSILR